MKKALLLSVVASGFIYAGGNITPVQPVQPAPAACDFWGTLALRYDAKKDPGLGFGKAQNNSAVGALAMGVEKELGYGFGFGAELDGLYQLDGKFNKIGETAGLMQAYVTYKAGNTVIKAGRQALPKAVSPWAYTERGSLGGIAHRTYNGITVVNTDLANTTIVGAWVPSFTDFMTNALNKHNVKINGSNKGLFALGAIYKGIANTTLSGIVYYIPKNGGNGKAFSAWAAAKTKVESVNLGLQLAYAKAKAGSVALASGATGTKASFGVAGYIGTNFNGLDAKLTLAYLNDGDATLNLSNKASNVNPGSGFWGATYKVQGGDVIPGTKQKIARLDLAYKLPDDYGKIYGGVGVDKLSGGNSKTLLAARVGYDFTIKGVAAKVEYRYNKDRNGNKHHRIRVQGVYKF